MPGGMLVTSLAFLMSLALPSFGAAQSRSPFAVPHSDRAPRWDEARRVLTVAALGLPDARLQRLSARRLDGRRRARDRALRMLHLYLDSLLAPRQILPWRAAVVHARIERDSRVVATRALVDGGAVVEVELDPESLSALLPPEGLPWQ